jgi:hypothetical protein
MAAADAPRDQVASRLSRLLATSDLAWDDRVHAAAVVFVTEALSPFWHRGYPPAEAHERLRSREPELAAAIEALAPMLLSRLASADEAAELIEFVEQFVITSPSR